MKRSSLKAMYAQRDQLMLKKRMGSTEERKTASHFLYNLDLKIAKTENMVKKK